ncbi:MAG: hypothetical protein LBU65_06525 [Planctomycetaceae bacterium]|jgi:hypothetical protein|nr:hypothetical protein [Planctomycetaceae bacterium]
MYAVKAIYDGSSIKLLEPAPFNDACEVTITFPEPSEIPLEVVIPTGEENDPFYSESNLRWLQESIKEADEGKFAVKITLDELLEMSK